MLSCKPSLLTIGHSDASPESKAAGDQCLWFSGDKERKGQYIITWFMNLPNSCSCTASIATGRSRPSLCCLFLSFCLLICTGPAHCVDVQWIKIEKWSGLKINPAEVAGFEADLFSRFMVWPQQCLCQKNGGEQTKVRWKKQNCFFIFFDGLASTGDNHFLTLRQSDSFHPAYRSRELLDNGLATGSVLRMVILPPFPGESKLVWA